MTLLLKGVVGSTAYNLQTESSDVDYLAIHLAPIDQVLGFGIPKSNQTVVSKDPDSTSHELGKYLQLALKCNPTILELLFLSDYEYSTFTGDELIENRHRFLTENYVRRAYGGYAFEQAAKILGGQSVRRAKHGRHCFRLLLQAKQLLTDGTLNVRLTEDEREEIFEAGRLAEQSPALFYDKAVARVKLLDSISTTLPDVPPYDWAQSFLVETRRNLA